MKNNSVDSLGLMRTEPSRAVPLNGHGLRQLRRMQNKGDLFARLANARQPQEGGRAESLNNTGCKRPK